VNINERMPFAGRNSLVEEKRRLEARVSQLEEEMDEEHVELEQMSEKARKSAAQVYYSLSSSGVLVFISSGMIVSRTLVSAAKVC